MSYEQLISEYLKVQRAYLDLSIREARTRRGQALHAKAEHLRRKIENVERTLKQYTTP